MLVQYSCTCGFKTVFAHKYFRHAKSCDALKNQENDARAYLRELAAARPEAG